MYIYGKNVVSEYLKNNKNTNKLYLQDKFNDQNINSLIENLKISPIYKTKFELDKLVDANHQGIILEVPEYEYSDIDELIKDDAFLVILDHLEDTHNLGAIIRTSVAASVDGIIIPKNRSVSVNSTVYKTSAGTVDKIKIAEVTNIVRTIEDLKKNGFWIIGTDMEGTDYTKIDYKGKIAIIIGNEGSGLSRLVKESCDFIATIPIDNVESLNASVTAGIIIYKAKELRM